MSPAKVQPVPEAVVEAFERFWKAYPPRQDNPKKPARLAFARLVEEGADVEALVRAAGAFAAHVKSKGFDPIYTPHARTWLAQERFEEWMTADVPASAQPTGPSPEHPLAALYPQIGAAAWASYVAPLAIERGDDGVTIMAPTRFALDRVRRDWGRSVEATLGAVTWTVRKDRSHG